MADPGDEVMSIPPGPLLLVVRHGQTEWSRSGRHTGRTDVPLTEEGEVQARALRARLAGRRFALALTSPLQRAVETAWLCGLEGCVADPDLVDVGLRRLRGNGRCVGRRGLESPRPERAG